MRRIWRNENIWKPIHSNELIYLNTLSGKETWMLQRKSSSQMCMNKHKGYLDWRNCRSHKDVEILTNGWWAGPKWTYPFLWGEEVRGLPKTANGLDPSTWKARNWKYKTVSGEELSSPRAKKDEQTQWKRGNKIYPSSSLSLTTKESIQESHGVGSQCWIMFGRK